MVAGGSSLGLRFPAVVRDVAVVVAVARHTANSVSVLAPDRESVSLASDAGEKRSGQTHDELLLQKAGYCGTASWCGCVDGMASTAARWKRISGY